jgi:peptidoglycan-N-acetylglucosamine deacetylase
MKLLLLLRRLTAYLPVLLLLLPSSIQAQSVSTFKWPEGKQMAISLSFDDARASQVLAGTTLLDQYQVKGTFYVVPSAVKTQLAGWKKAVAAGHEIGNHSLHHPCSGNFRWARSKALEEYTLDKMRTELRDASTQTEQLLGVKPTVFAYPCGQSFVGRGTGTQSYVPVVAELFQSGRGWLNEAPNDPAYCDMAQLTGMEMDGKEFSQLLPIIENARKEGLWLVLAGHEMDTEGAQTTRLRMLKELLEYARDPAHGIWIAPVGTVGSYILKNRK